MRIPKPLACLPAIAAISYYVESTSQMTDDVLKKITSIFNSTIKETIHAIDDEQNKISDFPLNKEKQLLGPDDVIKALDRILTTAKEEYNPKFNKLRDETDTRLIDKLPEYLDLQNKYMDTIVDMIKREPLFSDDQKKELERRFNEMRKRIEKEMTVSTKILTDLRATLAFVEDMTFIPLLYVMALTGIVASRQGIR